MIRAAENTNEPSRFEAKPVDFVRIEGPTLVYIGVAKREDFDKIAAPCVDNGQTDVGHVVTKTIGRFRANEITFVFQHWINQLNRAAVKANLLEAMRAIHWFSPSASGDRS